LSGGYASSGQRYERYQQYTPDFSGGAAISIEVVVHIILLVLDLKDFATAACTTREQVSQAPAGVLVTFDCGTWISNQDRCNLIVKTLFVKR
jgi:hypothetical protein